MVAQGRAAFTQWRLPRDLAPVQINGGQDGLIDKGRRVGGKGLRWIRFLSRYVACCRRGALDNRPDRLAGDAIEHERVAAFGDLGHRVYAPAIYGDRDEVGLRGDVPIPKA